MLLRTLLRFQSAGGRIRSPHEILGVRPGMSMSEIKSKYRELARLYHPDMPTGNPILFREVTAAYNIMKAEAKLGRSSAAPSSSSTAQQQPRRGATASNYRAHHESEETLRREGAKGQHNYNRDQYFAFQALWASNGWETIATVGTIFLIGVWTADVMVFARSPCSYKVQELDNLSYRRQQPAERFTPLPPEVEGGGEALPAAPSQQGGRDRPTSLKEQLRVSSRLQHFTTIRDFLFEHDLEGADVRRVSVSRFPVDKMDEASVFEQCPHHRVFNSESSTAPYSSVLDDLVDAIDTTPWSSPDASNAGVLVANALASVVTASPNACKWTIVEYRDTEKKLPVTECLFALRNDKFSAATSELKPGKAKHTHAASSKRSLLDAPMVQRIVISGSEFLVYPPSVERRTALAHKKGSATVSGGVVRMKDAPSFLR